MNDDSDAKGGEGCIAQAFRIARLWNEAFTASDVEGLLALFAPEASFIGTTSRESTTDRRRLQAYFEGALEGRRRRASARDIRVQEIGNEVAIVTALSLTGEWVQGEWRDAAGRLTLIIVRRGDEWLIVHFHRSAMPGEA